MKQVGSLTKGEQAARSAALPTYGLFSGQIRAHLPTPGQQVRAQNSRGPHSAFDVHSVDPAHGKTAAHLGGPLL